MFDGFFGILCGLLLILGGKSESSCMLVTWLALTGGCSLKYLYVLIFYKWTDVEVRLRTTPHQTTRPDHTNSNKPNMPNCRTTSRLRISCSTWECSQSSVPTSDSPGPALVLFTSNFYLEIKIFQNKDKKFSLNPKGPKGTILGKSGPTKSCANILLQTMGPGISCPPPPLPFNRGRNSPDRERDFIYTAREV